MIQNEIGNANTWVLSGSLCGWGDVLIPNFDLVIFLYLPREIRMGRLKKRESDRYGSDILPGGVRYSEYTALAEWAEKYDDGGLEIRSRFDHNQWLNLQSCPVLRIDGDFSVSNKVAKIEKFVEDQKSSTQLK